MTNELQTVGAMHQCRAGEPYSTCVHCGALAETLNKPCPHFMRDAAQKLAAVASPTPQADSQPAPIDMVLHCPACGLQHIDASEPPVEFEPGAAQWNNPPHRSHLCHGCGHIWRPADVPTNGVAAVKTTGKADSPIAARTPADSVTAPATESYVQPVPDKCDRIVWRGHYYHLPLTTPAQAADSVLEDAARWFAERDNVLQSFWVLLGEAEAQADNDNNPLLKHQVEGFYRQWNALNGSALEPRWVTRAARKQGANHD